MTIPMKATEQYSFLWYCLLSVYCTIMAQKRITLQHGCTNTGFTTFESVDPSEVLNERVTINTFKRKLFRSSFQSSARYSVAFHPNSIFAKWHLTILFLTFWTFF